MAQKDLPEAEDRQAAAEALRRPLRRFASDPLPLARNFNGPRALLGTRGLTDQYAPLTFCSSSSALGRSKVRAAEFGSSEAPWGGAMGKRSRCASQPLHSTSVRTMKSPRSSRSHTASPFTGAQ